MAMEKRRDEIGKVLACLLVSRKGRCDIRDLERDYRENEGKKIPYTEFGCSSSLDFFRSISKHIELEPRAGSYLVYPVVSDKIKHVDELVSRQRSAKRHTPVRRPRRISQYYPPVRDPKPFVPNTVQKEIARILTQNPHGVNKSYIAQCLEQSKAVADHVNVNNIDEYLHSMPYTATAHGNMVYPSRSLILTTTNTVRRNLTDIDGFEIVTSEKSAPGNEGRNNNIQDMNGIPGGAEEDEIISEDEYIKENIQPRPSNVENSRAANNDNIRAKISSAEFIDRAGAQYMKCDGVLRENNNGVNNRQNGGEFEADDQREQAVNCDENADYTFESDDDASLDIISPRIKTRLHELIQEYPEGLWCANLLQAYSDRYKVPLEYVDLGFGSVCEFASHLPKIFLLHRQNNRGDFKLYDATKPLPNSATEPESHALNDVWEGEDLEDDIDPFPMTLPLHTSQSLIPNGVMTHGESVGQERIPEIHDGTDCLEIYVVEVYTPSLFWIHLRKQRSKLSQLMESMHDFYQKEGDHYTIPHVILEKGLNCVCTFEDKWHRAIIKTVKPDGDVTLVFYDYGTTQTYPPDSVRFLVRTYSNLPAQAIPCGLYNVKPVNANAWTRGVSSEFYSRVADLPLVAMVVKVDRENNSMLVSLVDTQGDTDDHINDWLVHAGLAESGFMGDTVALECSYLEDQITQTKDAIVSPDNVPLVSPQSTLPENSGSTLKPPPGFTKPADPMNYAAFMDDCLNGSRFSSTETGNSTFSNFCNMNLNNNPLAFPNTVYNPMLPQSEAFIQFWKQKMQLELTTALTQFLLASNNASVLNDTILKNSSTVSSATSTDPIIERSPTNPFQTYQKENRQESSTVTNSLEELTNSLANLNTKSDTTWPNSETLPNPTSRDSNLLEFDNRNLFSSKPTEGSDKTFLNKTQNDISKESFGANCTKIDDQDFTAEQLHDTNPFKEHLIGGSDSKVKSREEQSVKANFEYNNIIRPPIPPRNPRRVSPVNNEQQTIPTTKIYYKGEPVMYNLGSEKTNETKSKLEEKTCKLDSEEQSPINLKQEQPDILYPTRVLNETSGLTLTFEKVAPTTVEQSQNSSMSKEDNTKLPRPVGHQEVRNLNGASSSKNSERLQSYRSSSGTKTGYHTTAEAGGNFDTSVKKNAFSSIPTLHSSQTLVNEQNSLKRDSGNSNMAFKDGITVDNNCFQSCNTELGNTSSNNISYSHQPLPPMPRQPSPPLYPNNPYSQQGVNYPYRMPPPDAQCLQAGQRVPLFNPNMHGFYAPAPHWPRPQFFNPVLPHLPHNISPPLRQPCTWNPYIPHVFVHKQTHDRPRMASNTQTTFQTDSSQKSLPSELSNARIPGQEKSGNIDTAESKKTPTDGPELEKHNEELRNSHSDNSTNLKYRSSLSQPDVLNTQAASQKVSENVADKLVKGNTTSTQGLSDAQFSAILLEKHNSEKSSNENVPQRTLFRNITHVFKPVEVNEQTIYIFNIENEGWVSTDEIALTFTQFENHNMILRLLELVHVQMNFKEVSRAQSPLLFGELDTTTIRLPRMTNSKRIKGILHLTPLNSLIRMMYYLKVISVEDIICFPTQTPLPPGSKVPGLVHLIKAYKSDDEYWTA